MFQPLTSVPDHPALEREVLAWWGENDIFERLRRQNEGGPRFSFIDGPITANNPMGVHHAWGRTLKDVFQRYKALRGFDQRYQNGFDCQGLWVEVEVEKGLGLNSKREIEDYGLAEFAERCKERVAHYAEVITQQSRRLGMWMDWDNDYYTFSDTNIEYIWRFLRACHERGWLFMGHRSTEWCPRCGTSISQHELFAGEYKELEHPSLFVSFPLRGRDGESLVVWTTTPWTLPANVAAAVKPDAEYVLTSEGEWWARAVKPDAEPQRVVRGEALVGLEYEGPFDELPAQEGVRHRVIAWDEVALDEGSGVVHIAPGAGSEDFELGKMHGLPVLTPIDEAGRFVAGYGVLSGLSTEEAAEPITTLLRDRGFLVERGTIVHRYPTCWRCGTPLVFRVVDDWFISAEEVRQPMLDANATVEWTPNFYSKRMDDWLRNMGDWNISRKRYFGLPLPLYPCDCGHLNVIGSKAELEERATAGLDQLRELHRPWIDEVTIRCAQCGAEDVRRITDVGDAWLDAGIVPFSTLGWGNEEWIPDGYATGASKDVSGADLPDHAYWERWFPADWVSEMREQIRLWFYAISFMSVTLDGRSPYRRVLTYEKLLDETGREMHRSWGNAIEVDEALERMGADVMRWLYANHVPSQNIKFGYGPASEVKRRLLTFWNSVGFLILYGNIEAWRPRYGDLDGALAEAGELRPLDRWLLARTQSLVAEVTEAYESYWSPRVTRAFEAFVDDLSNWYVRRSRARFWSGEEAAFRTLWYALVQATRLIAPVMPFLAEHVWRSIVAPVARDAPASLFLAGWPEPASGLRDEKLLAEVSEARRVVELGRAARAQAGVKLRQPLRRVVVSNVDAGKRALVSRQVEDVAGELRVKEVVLADRPTDVAEVRATPRLEVVGPRYGPNLPELRRLLGEGSFEVADGNLRAGPFVLAPGEFTIEYAGREGWAIAQDDGYVVAVDTELDDELRIEGRVLDLIHAVQRLRKEAGLEVTDRIVLTVPAADDAVLAHAETIKAETLATRIERGDALAVARAS
jgi:isoleucyl-tRNA synthetase